MNSNPFSNIVKFYLPENERRELNQALNPKAEVFTEQDFVQLNKELVFISELGNKRSAVFLGNPQSGKTSIISQLISIINPTQQPVTKNHKELDKKYGVGTVEKYNYRIDSSSLCHDGLNLIDSRGVFEKKLNETDDAFQQTRQDILHHRPNMIVVVLQVQNVKQNSQHCIERELLVLKEAAKLRTELIHQMKTTKLPAGKEPILPIHVVVNFIDEYDDEYQKFCQQIEREADRYKLVEYHQQLAEVKSALELAKADQEDAEKSLKSIEMEEKLLDEKFKKVAQLIETAERELQQLKSTEFNEHSKTWALQNDRQPSAPPLNLLHENTSTVQESNNSTPTVKATYSFSSLFGIFSGVFKRSTSQEAQTIPPRLNGKLELYAQKLQLKNQYCHERNEIEINRYQLNKQKIEHQTKLSLVKDEIVRYQEYYNDMQNVDNAAQQAYKTAYDKLHLEQEAHLSVIRDDFQRNTTFKKLLYESGILNEKGGSMNQHVYFHFTCAKKDECNIKHKSLLLHWGLKELADSIQTCEITNFERVTEVTVNLRKIMAGKIIDKFVEVAEKKAKLMETGGADDNDYPPIFWRLLIRTLSMIGDQRYPTRTFENAWKIISEGEEVKTAAWYYDMSKMAYKFGFIVRPIIPLGNWCNRKAREKIPLVGAWATNFYLGARGSEYVIGAGSSKRKLLFPDLNSSSKEGSSSACHECTIPAETPNVKRNKK
ncbi:hypothetical protein C9374_008763 [Naegleria lovaniensis]|uniref:Uncharacterized protein n=1 Tax=Naegleria lovaniensis TaxID=51637 RepID=A0AA88GKI8_NAELO|nr:uncharacterized protein C9374_008763 [Naegleria lovaniensis]KAG2378141.1 hypothetical protein C9374_008763 [Naegleria lovaniensis]